VNKRKTEHPLVVFGFCGNLQDDLGRYQGVMRVADAAGWQVLVLQDHFEQQLRDLLASNAVDGVIGEFISESWLGSLPASVPYVHVGQRSFSALIASVVFDPFQIGLQGYMHLKESGYERVGLYTPAGSGVVDPAYAAGFIHAADEAAILIHGQSELSQLLSGLDVPTGIFGLSDYDARHVIKAARRLQIPIPAKLGVLGLGNRLWDRIVADLEISSIPLPQEELGYQAATLLREQMMGAPVRSLRLMPAAVLARASSMRHGGQSGFLVRRAEVAFRENLALPLSIKSLCRRMRVSQRTLELAFQHAGRGTPYQRLLALRVEEACRLLRETDLRVMQIGSRIGYPDPQQFSAFFQRRLGSSPSAYRASVQAVSKPLDQG
jgi:DNA-binding LacI/PurR family transcriptional regulator